MEYTISGRLLPVILNNAIKKALKKYYDNREIKGIIKKTREEYLCIIKRTPAMGGNKNGYITIMYLGAYFIGLYKNTQEKISLEDFNELIQNGLNNCFLLKTKMKKVDYSGKKYKEKIHKNSKWAKENQIKFPWTWQMQIPENQNTNELYYEFTQCGLCKLCDKENTPEIMDLMCNIDYLLLSFSNFKLIRTKTLAQGNNCCDFRIVKN